MYGNALGAGRGSNAFLEFTCAVTESSLAFFSHATTSFSRVNAVSMNVDLAVCSEFVMLTCDVSLRRACDRTVVSARQRGGSGNILNGF